MPSASFDREVRLTTEPKVVWDTITDVTRLVNWVSILSDAEELEHLKRYRATLADRLGPFKLKSDLDIVVPSVQENHSMRVTAEGEDRQVSSRISVDAEVVLTEVDGGSLLHVEGNYEVAGRVATLGASMINKKAQKILDEFFGRVEAELG
jgi:uncharacterized protein